jgi:hypothetical protein
LIKRDSIENVTSILSSFKDENIKAKFDEINTDKNRGTKILFKNLYLLNINRLK